MGTTSNGARRTAFVAAGLLAAGTIAVTLAGVFGSAPQVLAECQTVTAPDDSFSMSCEPTQIPNTSTEDNLTEQEVAQPGYN